MVKGFSLPQKIEIFEKDCEINKNDILQQLELITYLTINEQITLDEAEEYLIKIYENA